MSVPLIQNSWRWTICYHLLFMTHPEAWLGKPYHLTLPASELTFSFSQCVFCHHGLGAYRLGTHSRPLAQFLLPCCVKSSFRTIFSLSLGKTCVDSAQEELFFLLSVCVVFCSSCKLQKGILRAFPDLRKAVELRGLLVHGRRHRPQPLLGSSSSSIPVMLVQNSQHTGSHWPRSHLLMACEGHKQIQKLRNQGRGLTLRS